MQSKPPAAMPWTAIGLLLALLGPGAVALLSQRLATDPETVAPRAVSLALFVALLLAVVLIARHGERLSLRALGFAGSSWLSLPLAVALAAFFVFLYGPAVQAALAALSLGGFDEGIARLRTLPRWYLVLAIVVVAAGEEWLYRAYAIERLEALTGNPFLAASLSLGAFVLVHLPFWGPGAALSTGVAGAILTGLYLWRRDILMLVLAHVATNLSGIALAA